MNGHRGQHGHGQNRQRPRAGALPPAVAQDLSPGQQRGFAPGLAEHIVE
jgi:hypothetical protein